MRHRLKDIQDAQIAHDGKHASLTLHTATAAPFTLELPTDRLDELIVQILEIARAAAVHIGTAPTLRTGAPMQTVPIEPTSVGVMLGAAGKTQIAFQVGLVALSFQVDNSQTTALGQSLASVGMTMQKEPPTRQ